MVWEHIAKFAEYVHMNIFLKNREISILTMKKKHNSKVNTSSRSHRKFQNRKDKTNKKQVQQYQQ
jgi:hypothetical protein